MKVFAFAIGARDRASSRWRVWDHLNWLSQDHEVRVDSFAAVGVRKADMALLRSVIRRYPSWWRNFFWSDAVLVQESMALWPAILFKNLGKRRRLVFDFSDPIDRVGTGFRRWVRLRMFRSFLKHADAIVVENPAYLDLYPACRGKSALFYGPMDVEGFRQSREAVQGSAAAEQPFRVGWTGSHGTYKFIQPLLPLIDEIARERPVEVVLVGIDSAEHDCKFASVTIVPFDQTADLRMVPTFDLGLFRLEDTEGALWRGAGKLFIYMSAGVPFIATDRGIASGVMRKAGVGFPVAHEGEWAQALESAIRDEPQRQQMTQRSLDFAQSDLSYDRYRRELLARLQGRGIESP